MRTLSFRDLLKVSWLSKYSEVGLLSIERDEEVNRVLDTTGMDLDFGVEYLCAVHRDLSGYVALGFMVAGEVSINRAHLTSAYADLTDIMVSAYYQDASLAEALGELTGKQRSYDHLLSLDDDTEKGFPKELVEPSCDQIGEQIRVMNELCESIRGPSHNSAGAVKTPEEYQEYQLTKGK